MGLVDLKNSPKPMCHISLFHIFDREHYCTGPPLNFLGKIFPPIYHPTLFKATKFKNIGSLEHTKFEPRLLGMMFDPVT